MFKYEDCHFCGGRVTERRLPKPCYWGNKLMAIVENVPGGVCEQCGEKYYKAVVLKRIETRLKTARKSTRTVRLPLLEYVS